MARSSSVRRHDRPWPIAENDTHRGIVQSQEVGSRDGLRRMKSSDSSHCNLSIRGSCYDDILSAGCRKRRQMRKIVALHRCWWLCWPLRKGVRVCIAKDTQTEHAPLKQDIVLSAEVFLARIHSICTEL